MTCFEQYPDSRGISKCALWSLDIIMTGQSWTSRRPFCIDRNLSNSNWCEIRIILYNDFFSPAGIVDATNRRIFIIIHGDAIPWKRLPQNWPFVRETHRAMMECFHNKPIMRCFDVSFLVGLNKILNKQSSYRQFEIRWCSLLYCAHDRRVLLRSIHDDLTLTQLCFSNFDFFLIVFNINVTFSLKLAECSAYLISTTDADGLLLYHQAISNHRAGFVPMCFQRFMD